MKSRTIVKNVARNSGGRSVKVLFSVQYEYLNIMKLSFTYTFLTLLYAGCISLLKRKSLYSPGGQSV